MIYYTADTHFGHHSIVQHRPKFRDLNEMHEAIVQGWNSVVQKDDEVYHLGDVFFHDFDILAELQGTKYLVLGNHDHKNIRILQHFFTICNQIVLDKEQGLVMSHYPLYSWPHQRYGWFHLHGHAHGKAEYHSHAVDVGVDCWDYKPITLKQIREKIDERVHHSEYRNW